MPSFNNQFLSPVDADVNGKIFDYAHAHQLFVADNYKLAPKYSFLYYVKFDRDPTVSNIKDTSSLIETGQLVNSVALPKFTIDSKTLNSYNRTNIIQTKIKYDPVQITFHDDGNNTVLDFWRDYYEYHYRDSDYKDMFGDSSTSNYQQKHKYHFNNSSPLNTWGYTLRNKAEEIHYLKNIRIYSLNRGTFTEYILVNPMITSFQHGQHTAADNGIMSHTMTIAYETVLYYYGTVTDSTVPGMLDLHYDRRPSPLTPFGLNGQGAGGFARPRVFGARGVFGNGGILDTTDQIIGDIGSGNIGDAVTKGFKAYQNNKGANLKNIAAGEAKRALLKGILTGTNPFSGVNIPVISNLAKGVGGAIQDGANWTDAKFGISQSAQNRSGSAIGAGYAQAGAASASYEANQKLNTDGTAGETDVTSNGDNVSTNRPGDSYYTSPTYRMPKDDTADINSDFKPVQLNGSVQGPNNAASLRTAQNAINGEDIPENNAANPGTAAAGIAFNQGRPIPAAPTARPGGAAFNQDRPGARPPPEEDSGSNWEPQTGGRDGGGYAPYYSRTMNNTPREDTSNQGKVDSTRKASPIPGLQGGGGTII
jgi:hypothetical protein